MKDKIIVLISVFVFLLISLQSFAQMNEDPAVQRAGEYEVLDLDAGSSDYKTVATELVQTLLLDDFETAGEWSAEMSRDYGYSFALRREGSPKNIASENNKYVLGVKVEFMKRAWSWVTIQPARRMKIKGISKTISAWVVGRNYRHMLSIIITDFVGRQMSIPAEEMIWVGWKKVIVNIPDTIPQENYKVTEERGLTFLGFRIDFQPDDIYSGPFYTYFDYLTADVDLFNEKNQNPDDMIDNW